VLSAGHASSGRREADARFRLRGDPGCQRLGQPVGVITDRDIICRAVALGKNPLELTARDCMTSPVVTVTPDASIEQCAEVMETHRLRRIPVVDAAGSCCGIVSQADVALRMPDVAGHVVSAISRHDGPPAQPAEAMATDPVCGRRIATASAGATSFFDGAALYFCSQACQQTFDERPEAYAAPA